MSNAPMPRARADEMRERLQRSGAALPAPSAGAVSAAHTMRLEIVDQN